ncbi:NAD(P)H-dependent oxidoreductase [Mangrovitalea sediminis]|uniref:NAD(P)H-dependent oxidoreductase n=1 Tax=Mangrovitalea sediminis TaxID=1982043 RepID=UPI000BE57DF2|nr:NAD(P)H-dependent oxidoreductase [Mangrovitalea sediminis]
MERKILVIQGHPDASTQHLCHQIGAAYSDGARDAGHDVRELDIGRLEFSILRSTADWQDGTPSPAIREAQDAIRRAQHLVLIYPLWLGAPPALLKGFLEQVFRPGFASPDSPKKGKSRFPHPLRGKSVRIVITMGMPSWFYRLHFGAHSLRSLKRNILGFLGAGPIRTSLVGMVEAMPEQRRERLLTQMRHLGERAR